MNNMFEDLDKGYSTNCSTKKKENDTFEFFYDDGYYVKCPIGNITRDVIIKLPKSKASVVFKKQFCEYCNSKMSRCNSILLKDKYKISLSLDFKEKENIKLVHLRSENFEKIMNNYIVLAKKSIKILNNEEKQELKLYCMILIEEYEKNNTLNIWTSSAYVNYCSILQEKIFKNRLFNKSNAMKDLRHIDYLLSIALKIKPENQVALREKSIINIMYFFNFEQGISCYEKIVDPNIKKEIGDLLVTWLETNLQDIDEYVEYSQKEGKKELLEDFNIEAIWSYFIKIGNTRILCMYGNLLSVNRKKLDLLYDFYLNLYKKDTNNIQILTQLSSLTSNIGLKKYRECLKYSTELLERIKDCDEKNLMETLAMSNIAFSLCKMGNQKKGFEIFENILRENPNNTVYFNYARFNFEEKNYLKALDLAKKALYILEDEITYSLIGRIYQGMKDYINAEKYLKISIAFMRRTSKNYTFIDDNTTTICSIYTNDNFAIDIKNIYADLIDSCIYQNKVNDAEGYFYILKDEFNDDYFTKNLYEKLKYAFVVHKYYKDIIKQKNIMVEVLNTTVEEFKDRINKEKFFSSKLLKVQQLTDIIEEEEYSIDQVCENIHEIAIDINIEISNSQKMNLVKNYVNKTLDKLSNESVQYIITAEYLYTISKDVMMDFAPIIIEYSRAIEFELKHFLIMKKVINKNDKLTLGQMMVRCNKLVPSKKKALLVRELPIIIKYRNSGAHSGATSLDMAEYFRKLIYTERFFGVFL